MAHSPAPWRIQGAHILSATGITVCEVVYSAGSNGEAFDANRCLIVHAPDLLDYVRRCASNDAEADALLKQATGTP